jgi:methyl-accepting chemotaxis protein/carbonic anhydrase
MLRNTQCTQAWTVATVRKSWAPRSAIASGLPVLISFLALTWSAGTAWANPPATALTPEQALDQLNRGNVRYVAGTSEHPHLTAERMAETARDGQHPMATVLTCSDSRVPAEELFDQGIGDVFVVRVAGNVCDTDEVGSIEYGVDHLGTPLLVVLGHSQCGAVTAVATGAALHGNIPPLVDNIRSAVESAQKAHPDLHGKDLVPAAITSNVWQSIDDLMRTSPAARKLVQDGKLKIVGAVYALEDGKVQWLGSHPEQSRLLSYTGGPAERHDGMATAGGVHSEGAAPGGGGHPADSTQGSAIGRGHAASGEAASGGSGHMAATADDQAAVSAILNGSKHESTKTYAKQITAGSHRTWLSYTFAAAAVLLGLCLTGFYARTKTAAGDTRWSWTLGAKLTGAFSCLVILLAGVSVYSVQSMAGLGEEVATIAEENIPVTDAVAKVESCALDQATALERAYRFLGRDDAEAKERFAEAVKQFDKDAECVDRELEAVLKTLEALPAVDEADAQEMTETMNALGKLAGVYRGFEQLARQTFELAGQGRRAQAELLEPEVEKQDGELEHEIEQLASAVQKRTETSSSKAEADEKTAAGVLYVVSIIGVLLGFSIAVLLTRSITRPVNRIIAGLNEGADQVNDASGQVSVASQQLAEGASEQASSLEETSSALEQMAAMTRTNAENAKQANILAGQTRQAADEGDRSMGKLNEAMAGINTSSDKISKIIKVIEEIAFQTNLLALNAAVEAARAGEHGKGFAVVADEVRNLAQRAAQAAKETTGLIEDAVHRARQGTEVATEVGKALGAIVGQATKVSELINGIASASQEQAQGVDQVNTAVSQMDKVTQQNAAGAEESASAAEELAAQAQAVKGIVNELVTLVGGTRESNTNALPAAAPVKKAVKKQAPAASSPIKARKPAARPQSPAMGGNSDFLPVNDSHDLKEF